METCQKLQETLEQFTPANSIDKLTIQFENIAQVVFNGRFVVNGEYEIHPIEIEFYYHDEEKGTIIEPQMYHIKELPYFPIGSLCPNRSGVDMTFEREGKYRASFLIRGYTYKSLVDGEVYTNRDISKKAIVFKPQYLWKDLFGNATLFKQGLSIIWVDNDEFNKVRIKSSARINVHKIEGEETDRMWRFTNLDAMI